MKTDAPAVEVRTVQPDAPNPGQAVEVRRHTPLSAPDRSNGPGDILALFDKALDKGVPVEGLEKLQLMFERAADRAAAQEFADAIARFQTECPPIPKNRTANIVSERSGVSYSYAFADLDQIAKIVKPVLGQLGLSFGFDMTTEKELLTCECTLRHVNGHKVTARFTTAVSGSPSMSGMQKAASTLTYAKRQALVQALGLTTCDPDTDGADPAKQEKITADQATDLEALAEEKGLKIARVLKAAGVEKAADILASEYPTIVERVKGYVAPTAKAAAVEKGDAAE